MDTHRINIPYSVVCSGLYCLGLCKYTVWRSHNDEIAYWRISHNVSPSLNDVYMYDLTLRHNAKSPCTTCNFSDTGVERANIQSRGPVRKTSCHPHSSAKDNGWDGDRRFLTSEYIPLISPKLPLFTWTSHKRYLVANSSRVKLIADWNQLSEGEIGALISNTHSFRNRVRKVITSAAKWWWHKWNEVKWSVGKKIKITYRREELSE
jgi:hypothetical protein